MRQKLAVVADNLVAGWAGSYGVARDVIAQLKRRNHSHVFTHHPLNEYFKGLSQVVWDESGLVGFLEES